MEGWFQFQNVMAMKGLNIGTDIPDSFFFTIFPSADLNHRID
jgi:hypothetical protein